MTDLTVLEGCKVRPRQQGSGEPVSHVSRHAAERYLERVEGATAPYTRRQMAQATERLLELFGGRCTDSDELSEEAGRRVSLHAGRLHVLVQAGTIVTVLPLGAPASGCSCKACERTRRRRIAKYRRSIDRGMREGMLIEFAEKQPPHRKQLVRRDRSAGRSGRGAALRERLETA